MSSVIVIQEHDKLYFGADSAVSIQINGDIYRISNNGKKLFIIDSLLIFCSGNMELVSLVMDKFTKSKNHTIENLQSIAKSYYPKFESQSNFGLDIIVGQLLNNKSIIFQISPYNNFEIVKNTINEGIGIWTGGIKTEESLNEMYSNLSKGKELLESYHQTFNRISYEAIGGNVLVYKLDNKGIKEIYNEKIIEKNNLKSFSINTIQKHLLVAERVVGRMIVGQNLLIRNDEGTVSIDGATLTVKDRSDDMKVKLGEYETNKFGLQVLDGAINIRTKGSTGNTGVILDKDGFRAYNNSGKEMFNLNSNTGSATFSGDLNGANGTFAGTLQSVDGTFTGTLNGNVINGATINSSVFNTTGKSNGYTITTKIDSSGYEYIHSSYGGIKIQYGVLNGSNSAFMVVPTQSSSLGAFVLRGVQFQIESSSGSLAMFANDSMVSIKPDLYVNGSIYQNGGDPVATTRYIDNKGFLTSSQADSRYANKSHTHTSIDTGYLTLSAGTLQANSGSLWIGQNTVKANVIEQLSNRDYKKNIVNWEYNALEMINSTPIRQFQYKTELDTEFPHVGIIVQESPVWVVDINGEGVEPNKIAVLGWKAIQEEDKKVEGLKERIETLELLVNQQNETINELIKYLQGISCQLNN